MCGRCSTIIMRRHSPLKACHDHARPRRRRAAALGALWTAREIEQQPAMLRKTHAALIAGKDALERFLRPLLDRAAMRVILTGAGTSGFIGECLAPHLAARAAVPGRGDPHHRSGLRAASLFRGGTPTLLVSFGRSGDSPESVAALDLADQLVGDIHHLAITCNRRWRARPQDRDRRPGEDDPAARGNARPQLRHDLELQLHDVCSASRAVRHRRHATARVDRIALAVEERHRGASGRDEDARRKGIRARGLSRQSCLQGACARGRAQAARADRRRDDRRYDSPLGFRHGPKTIVNDRTLVVIFLSNDAYTRRYDVDLLEEIRRDGRSRRRACDFRPR